MDIKNQTTKSNNTVYLFVIITLILALILTNMPMSSGKIEGDETIVGTIDGDDVTLADANIFLQKAAQNRIGALGFNDLTPESKTAILREIAAERILVKQAKDNEVVKSNLIARTKEEAAKTLLKKEMITKIVNDKINDEMLKSEYDNLVKKYKDADEVVLSHILVKDEDKAKDILKDLRRKKYSFEEAAKLFSIDNGTALKGGKLGANLESDLAPEFKTAIKDLDVGSYTKTPFKTNYGWHIMKLDSKEKAQILPFEQTKANIANSLKQKIIANYINEVLDGVEIETK